MLEKVSHTEGKRTRRQGKGKVVRGEATQAVASLNPQVEDSSFVPEGNKM